LATLPWRLIATFVAAFDFARMALFGRWLGWFVGSFLRIRRVHVRNAMRLAGLDASRSRVNRVYQQLGTGVFELLWAAGKAPSESAVLVRVDDWHQVERALSKGRGVVVATAHTGNWDLAACAIAQRISLTVITKHLSWRSLDRYWQSLRAVRGVDLIDAAGALRKTKERLAQGGAVVFLVDQVPHRSTGVVRFPFLGQMAEHDATFAMVAARYRVPVLLALPKRSADGTHEVCVEWISDAPPRGSKTWVVQVTRAVSAKLETFVEQHPEQWLWLHRRWKMHASNPPRGETDAQPSAGRRN